MMAVGTVQLVSMSDYARMRGCSEGAVRRAVRDSRITLTHDKIDPVAADAQWARNTRPRMGSGTQPSAPDIVVAGEVLASESYDRARTRQQIADANMAELKLQELQGELVRAADVRNALAKNIASLREGFLQLPSRLVPLLVVESDPAKLDALLRQEIHAVLAQLTEATE